MRSLPVSCMSEVLRSYFNVEKHHVCCYHRYCFIAWLHIALNKVQVRHFLLGLARTCHKLSAGKKSVDSKKTSQVLQFGPTMEGMPHVLATIIACLDYYNRLLVSLLPPSSSSVSFPCSIQSNPDTDYVSPLLRNFHGSPIPGVKARESCRTPHELSLPLPLYPHLLLLSLSLILSHTSLLTISPTCPVHVCLRTSAQAVSSVWLILLRYANSSLLRFL